MGVIAQSHTCGDPSRRDARMQRRKRKLRRRELTGRQPVVELLEPRLVLSAVGDFNQDGNIDVRDVDLLLTAVSAGQYSNQLDLSADAQLDQGDVDLLVTSILGTQ